MRDGSKFDRPIVITHIGAGDCGELDSYMALQASRIVLVEADPVRAKRLVRRTTDMRNVEVMPFAVDAVTSRRNLKVFNLPDWNSLFTPKDLGRLFPGLRLVRETEVNTISIADLMDEVDLDVEDCNWLVLDAPGSEMAILETLRDIDRLHWFSNIELHCGRDPLYEDGASVEKILSFLHECGYECMSPSVQDDPDLVCLTLRLSPFAAQCAALQGRVEALLDERAIQVDLVNELSEKLESVDSIHEKSQQLSDAHAHLEHVTKELEDHRRQIYEVVETLKVDASGRKAVEDLYRERFSETQRIHQQREIEVASLHAENERLSRDLQEKDGTLVDLQKKFDRIVAIHGELECRLLAQQKVLSGVDLFCREREGIIGEWGDRLQSLLEVSDRKVTELLESVRSNELRFENLEKSLKRDVVRGITNSTRFIESRIAIESYLDRGYMIPSMCGWAASADISLYLIKLIESRSYDLIVEFGSGTSTVLMASALHGQRERQRDRSAAMRDGSIGRSTAIAAKIVAFEHQRKYFDDTNESLLQAGVQHLVELNYAPLRDYVDAQGDSFLYYACQERIAEISSLLRARRGRILVFVDGPPGKTGKHARYPALPIVLQNFSNHEIDILLDDCRREDEMGIAKRWEEMLVERSLPWQKEVLGFEKGAVHISIR